MAKWKLLEEIVDLTYYGNMDYRSAVKYEIKKLEDRIEELRPLEERYG